MAAEPGKGISAAAGRMSSDAPADEAGIQAAICDAYAAREPLLVRGAGTKTGMLRPVQAARTLSTVNCTGITLYSPGELVLSARAGTTLAALQAALAESGQHMVAEPPDYSRLLATEGQQTLGGVVATNLSGPRRIAGGAVRDHVLGVRAINGSGELLRGGGRVLKNVTGLEVCKLLTGSHGTLAVLTEATVKVLPAPEDSCSVVLRGLQPPAAVAALAAALGSPFGVSGAAHLPATAAARLGANDTLTLARIEDFSHSVAYRGPKLLDLLKGFGEGEIWPAERSAPAWAAIRDADILPAAQEQAIWRISVRPSRGPTILAAAVAAGADGYMDWGGGLLMLAGPATDAVHAAITAAAREAGGVWMILRGPAPWRAALHVVPPEPPALSVITRRVKASMDPGGILNPGRLFSGV
jgi:glycolate oxidase FAD binding subunit